MGIFWITQINNMVVMRNIS